MPPGWTVPLLDTRDIRRLLNGVGGRACWIVNVFECASIPSAPSPPPSITGVTICGPAWPPPCIGVPQLGQKDAPPACTQGGAEGEGFG